MLSVVIPALNEEKTITAVIRGIKQALDKGGVSYEIIVVNDGSTDQTGPLAEKENVIVINSPYKKGYGRSLKNGIERAKGEFILTFDGDDQNHPEDILKLLEEMKDYDMVIGARTNINSYSRAFAKKILSLFANYLAEKKIPDLNSGFRIFKKEVSLKYFHILPEAFSFSSTITLACIKDGHSVKFIPIKEKPRKTGKSTINPFKDFIKLGMLILRLAILFSPFRIFLPVSLSLFFLGFGYIIYSIIRYMNVPDSGIFLVLSSLIIFFFGTLADQISYIRRKIK
jgi:glycosyltransferase involved in cell wall biosynthesis